MQTLSEISERHPYFNLTSILILQWLQLQLLNFSFLFFFFSLKSKSFLKMFKIPEIFRDFEHL